MTSTDEIIEILRNLAGTDAIVPSSDLYNDVGMVGDDFHEMIAKFATRYSVDMTNYLWYFHTDEEGQNFGALFIKPPYKKVQRIPVTPAMLAEFANKGKWDIQYPAHQIYARRYDLLLSAIMLAILLIGLTVILAKKYLT